MFVIPVDQNGSTKLQNEPTKLHKITKYKQYKSDKTSQILNLYEYESIDEYGIIFKIKEGEDQFEFNSILNCWIDNYLMRMYKSMKE